MPESKTILLVDDEDTAREILGLALEDQGFRILHAGDGLEALKVLGERPVDIVISDVLMPHMDGYRLCYEIRKNEKLRNMPFIIYTGTYVSTEDEKLGMEFGANGYIRKTAPIEEVMAVLEKSLSRGSAVAINRSSAEELDVMKEYSERLVRKLEEKNIELEQARQELLQINKALAEAERKYRSIVENSLDGIFQATKEGRYLSANPAMARIFGFASPEEMIESVTDIGTQVYFNPNRRLDLLRILEEKGEIQGFEFEAYRKDKRRIWISANIRAVKSPDGSIAYLEGMVEDVTDQKIAAEKLRELTQRILEAQELERKRIARELHDSIGQMLSAIKFRIQSAGEKIASQKSKLWNDLSEAWTLLEQSIHEVRRIAYNLRPSVLDDLGLISAVRSMCEDFTERTQIKVSLKSANFVPRLAPEVELGVFRIIQEALNNVEQHADATRLALHIQKKNSHLVIIVKDNGKGFDPASIQKQRSRVKGFGLEGIKERVSTLGGSMDLQSEVNKGVQMHITIPIHRNSVEA
jgi:PAS domain S-box-containing protein